MGSRFSKARRGVEAAAAFGEAKDKKEAINTTENDKGVINNNTNDKQEDSGKETEEVPVIDNKEPEIKQSILEDDINKKSTSASVIEPAKTMEECAVVKDVPLDETTLEEKIEEKEVADNLNDKVSDDNNRDVQTDGTMIDAIDKILPENKQSLLDFEETSTNESALVKEEALLMTEEPDLIEKELISVTKDTTIEEDLTFNGPVLSESNLLGENSSESAKSCEAILTPTNDKTVDEKISLENQQEEHDLSELIQHEENPSTPVSTNDEIKKIDKTEPEDKMDSGNAEVQQEQDALKHQEETNKQETLDDANIPNDTKTLDLVSNTDLFTAENSQLIEKNDNHVMGEEILKAHDENAKEKVDDLFLLGNVEKNGHMQEGDEVIPDENLEKRMKDTKNSSASLLDFGAEEPETGHSDATAIEKKDVPDITGLDFEPTGIESINTQDLQFLETSKAQNVTKFEDPEVENLLNF